MGLLDNRVALVTGAASGIGLASARAFALEGAAVVFADQNAVAAERAANEVRGMGGIAAAYQVDVASIAQLRALFDFVARLHGKLHVFFSHAGIQAPLDLDMTEAQFDRVIDVNLKSHFFATHYALPLMRSCTPHASIIYTSSTAGLHASKVSPLYSTTKAGILMLMRSMACQMGPAGIRANAICPGPVETAFSRDFARSAGQDDAKVREAAARRVPLGRIGQPDDMTGTVLFLASDASQYVTGISITVDGGLCA